MTVVCPNCGNEITAPKHKKKSVKCPYCDMGGLELGLDYFDEEDNPRQFSLINFAAEHPKTTRAALIGLVTAARTFAWWMENKELFAEENIPQMPITSTVSAQNTESLAEPTADDTISEPLNPHSEEAKKRLGQRKMHLRILVNGQKASPEKQAEADEMNIDLQGKYTLVDSCPFHY